ncbi:unnamed protein product [Rotaria sp. Silwood2]|nr:unnamed protein product [Rotaria sp. Silwood2]CAF4019892.1 unnamed protein product [Rotaria sp. Silwood2]
MISSNSSKYKNLNNKIVFGRLLETALNSLLVDEEKSTMVSNFVDDHAKDLYKYKYENYQLIRDDNDDEKEKKTKDKKKSNEKYQDEKINKLAALINLDDSKAYIENNMQLISQETIDYLKSWSTDLERDNDFIGMERVAHQTMIIIFIHRLIHNTNLNLTESIQDFFSKELNALRDLIRDNAEQKNQDFNTQNEKKEQQKRLGAGGILDPIEVIKSLPMVLLECLKSRDVEQLQDVLSKMTQEEADQHLDRCIKSGLLMVNTKNAEGDGEEETKNYEETGTQDIEK